jgi:xylulokinase
MQQYIIGVDVGTTGTKAVIFDLKGESIGSAYQEYVCDYPRPNWVEQDAQMLGEAVVAALRQAVQKAGISKGSIASISVSAQRDCVIFIRDDGKPMKMISWLDNRAGEEVARIEKEMGADRFYALTGLPLATAWILPKILWVQKNEPELWNKSVRVVQLHDFILRMLGAGDFYEDEPDASFWGFWDTNKRRWDLDTMKLFGISESILPKVFLSGTKVGTVSGDIAAAAGISENTPLCVGAGDQNSAAIGAGVVREGLASVSIGTGGLATVFMPRIFRDPAGKAMVTGSAVPGNWQLEGLQNGAAGVYRWFRDELALFDKMVAQTTGEDPYERINKLIEKSAPGARGLVFLPYLASAASPRYDQDARGTLIGLTFMHSRGDIARAVIEGITMEQKDILTSFRNAGVEVKRVRAIGGASKSPLWNQLQSYCYGCPVETLKMTDAAVIGAAICGSVGASLFSDLASAADALIRVDQTYKPVPDMTAFYDESYRLYCNAYESLAKTGIFKDIAQRQKE